MFQSRSSKISSWSPYFSKNLFRGGTNFGGSIFAVTEPGDEANKLQLLTAFQALQHSGNSPGV